MTETILKIDGMACGMCEAHVNEAIRNRFRIRKVSSSARKGLTRIESEAALPEEELKEAIETKGYRVLEADAIPCRKRRSCCSGKRDKEKRLLMVQQTFFTDDGMV